MNTYRTISAADLANGFVMRDRSGDLHISNVRKKSDTVVFDVAALSGDFNAKDWTLDSADFASVRIGTNGANLRVEYHAHARNAKGSGILEGGIFGDMEMYGDFRTLAEAREYAAAMVKRERVKSVDIRESHWTGFGPWQAGSFVETIVGSN